MDCKNVQRSVENGLIIIGSFILYFVSMGITHSFGILYPELINYFTATRSDASWIASLGSGLMLSMGPIAGLIEEKFGCRIVAMLGAVLICVGLGSSSFVDDLYLLYLTYGVLSGMGFCLCHVAANVSVNVHFVKRRAMAAGITSTGNAVGTILLPIIGSYVINIYTWRGTFIILAGVGLQGVYCALMLPNKSSSFKVIKCNMSKEPKEERNRSNIWTKTRAILANKKFLIFMFSGIFVSIAYFVPFVMLPDMLMEQGMPKRKAAMILTTSGIASIMSRIIFGFLSDLPCWNRMFVNGMSLMLLGVATSTLFFVESEYLYFLYSALLGIVTGIFGMYQSVIVVDIIGKETIGLAFGYLTFFEGLAVMIGPPIAGKLYDVTKGYDISFIVSGILFTIGGILSVLGSASCTDYKANEYSPQKHIEMKREEMQRPISFKIIKNYM